LPNFARARVIDTRTANALLADVLEENKMAVNSSHAVSEEEHEWLKGLKRTAPGRQLEEHFRCVDFVLSNRSRAECPAQQVAMFRRVFCRAYSENDRAFGLPRPTPKFVAIVNLSGYRALLYSERAALVRLLTMVGPEASQRVMTNVEAVIQHAVQHDTSVLFCFSLPWQSGIHQVHWEARTLERRDDGSVRDGAKAYAYTSEEVRSVAPTGETDVGDPAVMQVQVAAMSKHYAACNVDVVVDDELSEENGSPSSDHMQRLQGVLSSIKADRSRLLGEITALREEHAVNTANLSRESDERVAKVTEKAARAAAVAEKKLAELQGKLSSLTEKNSVLTKARAEAERSKAEQDLILSNEKNTLEAKTKLHELSAKAATDKLLAFQKTTNREREGLMRSHSKIVEDLERRLSDRTLECRKLAHAMEQASALSARLDEVIEQMRTEKLALQFETIHRRRRVVGLQCALAVAANKHKQHADAARDASEKATAAQRELQQMLEKTEAARKKLANEVDELKSAAPPPSPPSPPPPPKAADSTLVHAETQTAALKGKADEELEALSERFVKLGDEKTAWVAREAELQQQIADLQTQVQQGAIAPPLPPPDGADVCSAQSQKVYNNVAVVMPGNGSGWAQPVDLGVDPNGDPNLETVVSQAQLSLRALVDLARQGITHKQAASDLWSENQAMRRHHEWQPQPPPMYYAEPVHYQNVYPAMGMRNCAPKRR
jgi:hypothetical protein